MFRSLDGKSVLIGVALTVVFLKFVAPRSAALSGIASKIS